MRSCPGSDNVTVALGHCSLAGQSEGKLRGHVRAHTALTEEPRSSTGAHMEPGQGLSTMVPVAPEVEARVETGRHLGLSGWPF